VTSVSLIIELSLAMFFAAAFRTTFGFGEALIAVPLLSLFLPVKEAAPTAVLASIVIAVFAVIRDRKHIHFSSAKNLLIGTAFGVPFGLLMLRFASESMTKALLGLLLISFSVVSLYRPQLFLLKDDRFIWIFGFVAGVTGGSYGMNGPPLAIYGASRRWSPAQFRATIQAYFLPASALGMGGYLFSGLWTKNVNFLFSFSLPAILLGIFAGNLAGRLMDEERLGRILYYVLILVACILMLQSHLVVALAPI
jgi:uncharacterized membrane protein YfcA